jgi:hypothetical protein
LAFKLYSYLGLGECVLLTLCGICAALRLFPGFDAAAKLTFRRWFGVLQLLLWLVCRLEVAAQLLQAGPVCDAAAARLCTGMTVTRDQAQHTRRAAEAPAEAALHNVVKGATKPCSRLNHSRSMLL